MLETYTEGGEDRFEKSKITGRNQKVYLESMFTSLTGLDGDIRLRKEYDIENASVNSILWIKVVGKSKPRPK